MDLALKGLKLKQLFVRSDQFAATAVVVPKYSNTLKEDTKLTLSWFVNLSNSTFSPASKIKKHTRLLIRNSSIRNSTEILEKIRDTTTSIFVK